MGEALLRWRTLCGPLVLLALVSCAGRAARSESARPTAEPVQTAPPTAGSSDAASPTGACPAGMVRVPGGVFVTGAASASTPIAELCVDVTEVTVAAYEACVREKRCIPAPTDPRGARLTNASCNVSEGARVTHPINCIDPLLAATYCRSLDKRLPDDAEWLWIARGGARAAEFPWGAVLANEQACWSGPRALDGTCGAGTHPDDSTAEGVLDLAGNVAEWTRNTAPGPGAPTVSLQYRARGGHFASRDPRELRSDAVCAISGNPAALPVVGEGPGARELRMGPREVCGSDALRSPVVGFRCVRSVEPNR